MPRVKLEDRKRAKRPKTRTGCRTCKIRKVKCDEVKPDCRRCTSTGRKCDGYECVNSENSISSTSRKVAHGVDTFSSIFESAKEKRAFQFFQERTSQQITGLSEFEFWNRTILQAIFIEPSIRCAIVAFGSFHEGFEKTGNTKHDVDDFALKQYNAAIRHHLANISGLDSDSDRIDSYVASCIIFVSIEILQGHYQSALSLVKGAVQLFYQCNESPTRVSAWPLDALENLLSRLQSQAVGLIGFASVGTTVPPRLKAVTFPPIPDAFTNVSQAKEYIEFYSHMHALTRSATEKPGMARPETKEFEVYLSLLNRWSEAFESLLSSQSAKFTDMEQQTINILKIWQTMTACGISMHIEYQATVDDQILWDNFEGSSRRVVTLAEEVLRTTHNHANPNLTGPRHQFTLDIGIVAPLYDTARICRDPLIRRKAINLLRQYPCREGLWDSMLAARAAERQMEIEESAVEEVRCAADVPGWARVTTVLPTFHLGERWAEVVFTRQQSLDGSEAEWFREVFEW